MTTTKHTPEPWMSQSEGRNAFAVRSVETGQFIGRWLPAETTPEQRDESPANLAMMIAAPELLAALKGIEDDAQRAASGPDDLPHMRFVLAELIARVARAAIAKAEGGA